MKEVVKPMEAKNIKLNHELGVPQQLRNLADQMEALEDKPLCFGICFLWLRPNEWDTQGFIPADKNVAEIIVKFFQSALDKYISPMTDHHHRDQGPH